MAMDYSLVQRNPDGTGQFLVTTPGSPDVGSYETEAQLKTWIQQDITDGTITAKKAECDQYGNVIDTTYAKETDLTDVSNALQATNARVENLEQEHGSYQEVTVKSPYTIPSGKAKNWSVNVLRGVTRAKNQLLDKSTWGSSITQNGVTFTNNGDGSVTVSTVSTGATANTVFRLAPSGGDSFQMVAGHQYLMAGCPSGGSSSTYMLYDNYYGEADTGNGYIYNKNATRGMVVLIRIIAGAVITTPKTFRPIITDLTTYFGGTIPSDAQTIADIQKNYPELLIPSDYGSSLVDTEYGGANSISRNLLDMSLHNVQAGATYTMNADGSMTATTTSVISNQYDYTGKLEAGTYTLSNISGLRIYIQIGSSSDYSNTCAVGASKTFVYDGSSYLRFLYDNQGVNTSITYKAQIERGSTATSYSKFGVIDTLSLPTSITLRSAGTVADTLDVESGVITSNVKQADITLANNDSFHYTNVWFFTFQKPTDYVGYNSYETPSAMKTRLTFPKYEIGRTNVDDASNIGKICGDILPSSFTIGFAPNTTLAQAQEAFNGKFNYALATPTTEQLDPIENTYLATEPGGTISSILTDAVDDSMTLGYINL